MPALKTVIAIFAAVLLVLESAGAVVVGTAEAESDQATRSGNSSAAELNDFLEKGEQNRSPFPYWDHVGKVGMGSGVYLGDGYVLTSAHVGCFPFVMHDGSYYRPDYDSWTVLKSQNEKSGDLAIFRVKIPNEKLVLSKLERLPISLVAPKQGRPLVLTGTGLRQSGKISSLRSNGKTLAILGYHAEARRGARWGINSISEVPAGLVSTGRFATHCFVTQFDQAAYEAQAASGDSGGPAFAYNEERQRWELLGCIVAVSHKGLYVPLGSQTFIADLSRYARQLPSSILDGMKIPELEDASEMAAGGAEDTAEPLALMSEEARDDSPAEKPLRQAYPAVLKGQFPD